MPLSEATGFLLPAICPYGIIALKLNTPATLLSREVEGTALRSLGNQADVQSALDEHLAGVDSIRTRILDRELMLF